MQSRVSRMDAAACKTEFYLTKGWARPARHPPSRGGGLTPTNGVTQVALDSGPHHAMGWEKSLV